MPKFSERHGYRPVAAEIGVRQDAPADLRRAIVILAEESGLIGKELRSVIGRSLVVEVDDDTWRDRDVRGESQRMLDSCPWPKVYDICEAIFSAHIARGRPELAGMFQFGLQAYFEEHGIGWSMERGHIKSRGDAPFERSVRGTIALLAESGRPTAARELSQAIDDLSRRPVPDTTGAVHHAMAALESVVRGVAGDSKQTLGELLKRYSDVIPRPLDQAVEKAWGYASERGGRHGREGDFTALEEAELIVGLSGAVSGYLIRKLHRHGDSVRS